MNARADSPRARAGNARLALRLVRMLAVRTAPALFAVAFLSTLARADGCFVWRPQALDIREPEQKALIVFDRGVEDLVLEVRYQGASEDFGWIVPLPSRPAIATERPELFEELSVFSQGPRHPVAVHFRGGVPEIESHVTVIERRRVGVYDTAVLSAGSGGALAGWLGAHSFRLPPGGEVALDRYARRGWLFAALRIHPAERGAGVETPLAEGTIQPLRFRFATREPIYPLAISAVSKGRTTVLLYVLAPKPLVHRTCNRAVWGEHVLGPFNRGTNAQARYRGLDQGHGYLSKLRAVVEPRDMEDVRFQDYDPFPGLRSPWLAAREEAASDLGWRKPAGADTALVRFLDRANGSGRDVLSALWALGEVGGPLAVATLERRVARSDSAVRLEAFEALSRAGGRGQNGLFVRALEWTDRPREFFASVERRTALDFLLEHGDSACIAPLRSILSREHEPALPGTGVADMARAALAACGDAAAMRSIRDDLAREAAAIRTNRLVEAVQQRANSGSPPMALWAGQSGPSPVELWDWPSLGMTSDLLEKRPDLRDGIFRELVNTPGLSDAARIVLASRMDALEPADRDTLFALWSRALGPSRLVARVAIEGWRPVRGRWEGVSYNLNACGVAYAFARLHDADALLRLRAEAPADDPVLVAEISHAMAVCGSSRLAPAVVQYVTTEWNRLAGDSLFERSLVAPWASEPVIRPWQRLDLPYRMQSITWFLCHVARDTSALRGLMTDPGLRPALRILWIENVPFDGDLAPLRSVAMAQLDAIEHAPGARAFDAALARDARAYLAGRAPQVDGVE